MADTELFWWKRCGTCRKSREFLTENYPGADERDFFAQPLSTDELKSIMGDRKPSELFSYKSPTAKAQGITPGSHSEDELLELMTQEPRFLRRPLLKHGDNLLVGFNQSEWEAELGK